MKKILLSIFSVALVATSFAQVDRSKAPEPGPAPKIQIKDAVEEKYNVTVEKVRTQIYGSERKTKFTKRGVQRTKTNIKKKAIVDIQDGDSIDFYNNL